MSRTLPFVAALLISTPALAGDWQVQPDSAITFTAMQSGEAFTGALPAFAADITFDPTQLENAHVLATMPLAGITTGSGERDSQLPTADWLDLTNHPAATFESSEFSKVDDTHYIAKGHLTLRGVVQPLDLPFELQLNGDHAVMNGSVGFKRTAFDVGKNWPATGDVGDDIQVNVTINAVKTAPAPAAP